MRSAALPLALVVLLVALLVSLPASAQAPLITGFGGAAGYGPAGSCLQPNDDGSSASIDITSAFPSGLHFFSGTYTNMYVNTNGNITFAGAVSTFTPAAFPVASQPMIAPYWADVDIRNDPTAGFACTGSVGLTCSPCSACRNPSENGVWWYLEPGRIVVTWDRVGYYGCHTDHRMNFQLILTENAGTCGSSGIGSGNFDVEFRYNQCQWEAGDASGGAGGVWGGITGAPAQAGFDAGDSVNYVAIAGSRLPGISTALCTGSNVTPAEPGVWRFGVRGGVVMCPDAGIDCPIPGGVGVCAAGRTQCVMSGTVCQPVNTASPEVCDALDNDCNGMTDDGDTVCPPMQVCDRGVCVPRCFESSCADGQTCTAAGICVDTACLTTTCADGERCVAGTCVGACDGITCPLGQQCRAGACVDACAGVTCDTDSVCEDGVCLPECPCRMCAAGEECATDGHCVDTGCTLVTCDPGDVCVGGTCLDACSSAVCPAGQMCVDGSCTAIPDAGPPDLGGLSMPDLGTPGGDAGVDDAGEASDLGCEDGSRLASCHPPGHTTGRGGCCSVAGADDLSSKLGGLFALGLALLGVARRRRKR